MRSTVWTSAQAALSSTSAISSFISFGAFMLICGMMATNPCDLVSDSVVVAAYNNDEVQTSLRSKEWSIMETITSKRVVDECRMLRQTL